MDERKKKKRRATLSDYKTDYAVEGQFKLDMTLIPRKKSKQPDMMKNTRTTASTDEPCCSTSRGQTFEIPVDISDTGVIDKNTCSTVVFDLPEISAVEKYRRLLIDNDAFLVWDEQMTTFIILDYNSESNTLKNVPQLVSRSSRQLFTCMCDEERMNFVDNFGTGDVQDIDHLFKPCLHIQVVRIFHQALQSVTLVEDIEQSKSAFDHDYNMTKLKDDVDEDSTRQLFEDGQIQEISFLENHFVVYTKGSFSIVKVIFGQLKCLFCNGKIECQHLKFVDKLLNKYEHIDLPEVLDRIYGKLEKYNKKSQYELKCSSYTRIPFQLLGDMKHQIYKDVINTFVTDNEGMKAIPSAKDCPYCGNILPLECSDEGTVSVLVTKYRCLQVLCYKKLCTNTSCKSEIPYDGRDNCILNMGSYLVHYEVLRDFMFQFLYSRVTMFSFYNVLTRHHIDAGNDEFKKIFPYSYFRHSWYSFLDKLDVDYDAGFICDHPNCGTQPQTLLFDGTSLSFQKQFHHDLSFMTDYTQERLKGSRHKDRVFIKDKTTRDIMLLFCKKDAMFEHNDFLRMKNRVKTQQQALVGFLVHLEDIGCIQSCPEEYRDFIRMLSCNSPVCAAIPYGQLDNIKYIIDNKNFRKNLQIMKSIQGAVPVLFNLICAVPDLPQFIRDILSAVVDIITKTFILDEHKTSSNVTQDALAYFPNLPKIRCRGLYAMDKKGDEKVCTKKGSRHPSLLPGIFTVFCPHGICYGFEVMDSVESPDRPFTFLKTRFEVPPTAIIYDNACNLQQYCLNRDPGFFKKTRFYVDGLHWDCHGCAVSYKGLLYPEIQNINTQLVEQNNAKLKKLKPSLSYMKAENFMKSVTFFEWHCNQQLKD